MDGPHPFPLVWIGYPLFAAAALNFVLGAILVGQAALRQRRRESILPYAVATSWASCLFCLTIGVAYVRASRGLDYDFYYRGGWVGWLNIPAIIQLLYCLKGDDRRRRIVGGALWIAWTAILILCLTTDLVETGASSLYPFVDRRGPFETAGRALGALCLGYALYMMYAIYRDSRGRRRQQISYLLLGLALYGASGLLFAGIFQFVGGLHFDPGLVAFFSIVWTGLTFYAITRHRLFDIRFVLSRGLSAVMLTLLFGLFNIGLFRLTADAVGGAHAVVFGSLLSAVLLFMTPVVSWIRERTARLFMNDPFDYQRTLKESAEAMAALVTSDEVAAKILSVSKSALRTISGAVLLADDNGFHVRASDGLPARTDRLPPNSAIVHLLGEREGILVWDEQEEQLSDDERSRVEAELRLFVGQLLVPIRYRGALTGLVILGRKQNRDAFFQRDIDLLDTLAVQTAIALTNARLLEELRDSVRVRDDFLSVAGHELRTPLTAMQLQVQILQRGGTAEDTGERLSMTQRQISRLTRLTNELLDVSRITGGRLSLERERFDLSQVVREVAGRFSDEMMTRGRGRLELSIADNVIGNWDRVRLEQVISNLFSNAVKYGEGKPISVVVERIEDRARLTIRDSGIGIDSADQQRIFGRFEQAVSQRHYGGFGLGLWITKQVVEAHGGTIELHSEKGQGATFVFELPTG